MTRLARGQGVTVWRQIAETLEREIAEGTFAAGTRLPTEAALTDRFGVNRHTVRQAIRTLVERGLVRVVQGSGAYVEAAPLRYPVSRRTRFSEIVLAQAREPSGGLLGAGEFAATPRQAEALMLGAAARLVVLETTHAADGVPLSWASVGFPLPRFAGIDAAFSGSVTQALASYGVTDYTRAWTRLGADIASDKDALRLGIATGRPVIVMESVNVDANGVPVQWALSRFAGDRVRIDLGA